MSGTLHFSVPKGKQGPEIADALAKRVRLVGESRGLKIPTSISLFGKFGCDFMICYTTNAMRDLILAEAEETKIDRQLYDRITKKWYTVTS